MGQTGLVGAIATWASVIAATVFVVWFGAFGFMAGVCNDSAYDDGRGSCTTEPAIGTESAWVLAVVGAVVVAIALWRIVAAVLRARRGRRA